MGLIHFAGKTGHGSAEGVAKHRPSWTIVGRRLDLERAISGSDEVRPEMAHRVPGPGEPNSLGAALVARSTRTYATDYS